MAKTISQIADKVACGSAGGANTGKLGCLSLFGTPEHLIALKNGVKIEKEDVFDLDLIKSLIMDGNAIPLISASMFEDVSAEDTYSENARGIKRLNLKGLPEYRLTFEEGHEFYRQIDRMTGYKNWNYIIGDDEGNWILVENADGSYKGFTAGHTTVEQLHFKEPGGEAESRAILIQFLNRIEFDRNYAILHQDKLDFSPSDIPAVNGVYLELGQVPVAGTDLYVNAFLAQDRTTPVEGLTSEFYVSIDGTWASATATESDPGEYKLTVSAMSANDKIVVQFADKNNSIIESNDILYRALPLHDVV